MSVRVLVDAHDLFLVEASDPESGGQKNDRLRRGRVENLGVEAMLRSGWLVGEWRRWPRDRDAHICQR